MGFFLVKSIIDGVKRVNRTISFKHFAGVDALPIYLATKDPDKYEQS